VRTQVTITPTFWTKGSGKKLRGKPHAQVLALYFMTSPQSTHLGIYYCPLVSILHETGLTEDEFRAALPLIQEIAQYDEAEGIVFLPEGAAHQIGETLTTGNKIRKSVLSQLEVYGSHPFVVQWVRRYYDPYHLEHEGIRKPTETIASPFDAPSMGHARVVHAPDPRSNPETRSDQRSQSEQGEEAPIVVPLKQRAELWAKNPNAAAFQHPDPHRWTEALELAQLVATTFGIEPDVLRPPTPNGSLDGRVRLLLERWAEGTCQARMREAIRGAKNNDLIARNADLQSLQTIFKDANAVDKYCRLAKGKDAPRDKSNRQVLTPEAAEKRRKLRAREF